MSMSGANSSFESAGTMNAFTSLKVLIVDDNTDAADMMALFLESDNYEVRVANCGTDALLIAQDFLPDVVFLDIGLPDMTGYDVAKSLREKPQFSETYLIALTGFGDDSAREKSKEVGFNRHLTKPADLNEVEHILSGVNRPVNEVSV